jgi:hypothetical protein
VLAKLYLQLSSAELEKATRLTSTSLCGFVTWCLHTRVPLSLPVLACTSKHDDQIKEIGMGRTCGTPMEIRNTYTVLVGKAEEEGPLVRPRCRWAYNIVTR